MSNKKTKSDKRAEAKAGRVMLKLCIAFAILAIVMMIIAIVV